MPDNNAPGFLPRMHGKFTRLYPCIGGSDNFKKSDAIQRQITIYFREMERWICRMIYFRLPKSIEM